LSVSSSSRSLTLTIQGNLKNIFMYVDGYELWKESGFLQFWCAESTYQSIWLLVECKFFIMESHCLLHSGNMIFLSFTKLLENYYFVCGCIGKPEKGWLLIIILMLNPNMNFWCFMVEQKFIIINTNSVCYSGNMILCYCKTTWYFLFPEECIWINMTRWSPTILMWWIQTLNHFLFGSVKLWKQLLTVFSMWSKPCLFCYYRSTWNFLSPNGCI